MIREFGCLKEDLLLEHPGLVTASNNNNNNIFSTSKVCEALAAWRILVTRNQLACKGAAGLILTRQNFIEESGISPTSPHLQHLVQATCSPLKESSHSSLFFGYCWTSPSTECSVLPAHFSLWFFSERLGNADVIQPGLNPLQPNCTDTFEFFQGKNAAKTKCCISQCNSLLVIAFKPLCTA